MKKIFIKKFIAIMCIVVMLVPMISKANLTNVFASENNCSKFEGDGYTVKFSVVDKWDGGYNANITINNISDKVIDNWYLAFYMDSSITNIWNAEINSSEDGIYIIKNAIWN